MIQLDRIERRFGRHTLFEGLSWRILADQRLGLVGPNGAGKTTLLRLLAGFDQPDSGRIHRGQSVRVAYLPQEVESVADGAVLEVALSGMEEVGELEWRLERLETEMSRPGLEAGELAELTERYGELRHRFENLDGDRAEARARAILSGLGVPEARFHEPLAQLSGGWRMRVVLARLLLGSPDLLLLDEPTNHLDLEALEWLERFLSSRKGAFVVVSHDRYFLNRLAEEIVEVDHGRLWNWPGNYDAYLEARALRDAQAEKEARARERKRAEVTRFIERFRYKATKARQVQSRIKQLEKEKDVERVRASSTVHFGFPPAPRSGDVVAHLEDVGKRFDANVVYRDLNWRLRRGERVALVGPNGTGKSTLLKLLAGRLEADEGDVTLGHNVLTHYYAQHQLDELDRSATVLEEMRAAAPGQTPGKLRNLLGCFLFRGDDVDKLVGVLSGGEKARLALARMLLHPANLLLLDEPTNHLDLASREVLEEALNEYEGTLVVVSHDRYFINRVATTIAETGEGTVRPYAGDYDSYQERHAEETTEAAEASRPATVRDQKRDSRRREAEERNRLYREEQQRRKRLDPVETEIGEVEREIEALTRSQAEPAVYQDPGKAAAVARDKRQAEERLEALYAEWERLAEESS